MTTGADGVALLPNLEPDWYVITEVACPPNYILDSTPHTAEIKANETCEITLENYAKPSLEITKVDADAPALKLEGATFRIAQRGSKKYQDITTGPDGIARLTGMEPDYYIVTEITAPNGYILSDEEHTVEIVEGKVTTITLSNQKKSSLSILKIDSVTGQPLANATFEIGYKNGETIGRFTSDEDGFVRLPQIDPGLIVVTEITAPDGYIIDLREQEVLLNPGEEKILCFENTPASPVILKKVDMEGNPLAGATFRLTKMNGELVGEYTTGRNGFVTIPELDPGWYVAVEIKAPDGYILNDTPQKVELKAGEPAILEFENEELPHLQIYKYDSVTKKPLAGVTIRVEKLNGERIGDFKTNQAGLIAIPDLEPGAYVCYEIATAPGYQLDMTPQTVELDADGRGYVEFANIPLAGLTLQKIDSVTKAGIGGVEFLVTKLNGGEIGTYTTDGDGRIFIPNLEEQYVRVREISVPDGYKLDTTEKIVELKAGEANAVEFENHPYPYLVIYKLGDDGQPLPGVSFKITNDAGRELGTYTTNSAGRIVLTGIDEGHYVVQEVEAAEGYELDATPYDVYLQWGKTSQIKLKNKELGSLSLVKVSAENGKQVLPGASFLLYDEKDNLIGEYTTDENGEILLDHALKAGLYTLKEIKAPDGFVLDDQTQKVEIKNGTTIRLTWPNTPERGRIRIEKVWEEIVSNCSTQLVLGVNDVTTATYISKKCGMVTIRTNSTVSPQLPPLSFLSSGASANRYSQSCSEAQRPLMLPDEVEHMDKARCLALISGRRPVMLYKLIPEELPGFDKMGLVKISDYKPHWKEKDAQYQKTAAAPQVHIPSAGSHSVPCNPLSHPAFRTDGTSQLQIPMESRETYHYELPRQQKKPSPAAEDRVGNMRRYTAQEVLAQTRCKATPNTGEVPPRKKDEII